MLKNFKLRQKFTTLLVLILVLGLSVSGLALSSLLRQKAEQEIASTGFGILNTITSLRDYTVNRVTPELLDDLETNFLPQTVAAYAARESFENLRKQPEYKDLFYKEAALNPTNLRDKADEFETQLIQQFISDRNKKEVSGFRSLPGGEVFYIARPLTMTEEGCLQCHSTPDVAPKTMIERYGSNNGFGWKLNEVIAAQIITLPSSKVIEEAQKSSLMIILIVSAVFITVILLVNIFLERQVIRPLKRLTRTAEEVSTGHMDVEFQQTSNDEIGNLAKAFQRMKFSLQMAMRRLRDTGN